MARATKILLVQAVAPFKVAVTGKSMQTHLIYKTCDNAASTKLYRDKAKTIHKVIIAL